MVHIHLQVPEGWVEKLYTWLWQSFGRTAWNPPRCRWPRRGLPQGCRVKEGCYTALQAPSLSKKKRFSVLKLKPKSLISRTECATCFQRFFWVSRIFLCVVNSTYVIKGLNITVMNRWISKGTGFFVIVNLLLELVPFSFQSGVIGTRYVPFFIPLLTVFKSSMNRQNNFLITLLRKIVMHLLT